MSLTRVLEPELMDTAEDAFDYKIPKRLREIIAVPTQQRDVRHLVQESMFTMHGNTQPLNKIEVSKEYLMCWEIPSSSKSRLRLTLDRMGMNVANLFPDLENLARHVSSLSFRGPISDPITFPTATQS